jgi:hypothetical protein
MENVAPQHTATAASLPLVVQLGFAGARKLYDATAHPNINPAEFEDKVQEQFQNILDEEVRKLTLGPQLFLCGISSLAVGGDTIFTKACQVRGMVQRVFLPQAGEEFLKATGSDGSDFADAEQAVARKLLASAHVIQERVVSDANDRHERFQDVNLEIVRVSDLLVCLVRADQDPKAGGSREVLALASRRKRPVLEVQITVKDGHPDLRPVWHRRDDFKPPTLPRDIDNATLPEGAVRDPLPQIDDYTRGLKNLASGHANWGRKHFTAAAFLIIGAHVAATILAVFALKFHGGPIAWLLGVELLMLAVGFSVHQYLHWTHRVQRWALSRLAAEVARSVSSIGRFHIYLQYLFTLPFPPALRPLMRTINVLHLRSTAACKAEPWEPKGKAKRDQYVHERLTSVERKAQIKYNEETRDTAAARLTFARRTFIAASLAAFVGTLIKLLTVCDCDWFPVEEKTHEALVDIMGFCAVVLPVIAVAALSLASALDLEARHANSSEMYKFLLEQKTLLENASSAREYSRLLIETESRLLGETVNWYARRSFLGVS